MLSALRPTLAARLSAEFGAAARLGGAEPQVVATFAARHATVGDAVVLQQVDEIVVAIEPHTHRHFGCDTDRLTPEERVHDIVEQVVMFLHALFADQVVFGDRSALGGGNAAARGLRASVGRALFGGRPLVWSGPVGAPAPMRSSLRLIARCGANEYAAVVDSVVRSAAPVARLSLQAEPEPYWKIEGHATFVFRVEPASLQTLAAIMALEPQGWDRTAPDPEADCVWNAGEGRQFLHAAVVFAVMELLPYESPAPDRTAHP